MMEVNEARAIVEADMKESYELTEIDYFVWNIYTDNFEMRYEVDASQAPECADNGGYGGYVRIIYDALNDEVTERDLSCHVGDWGV